MPFLKSWLYFSAKICLWLQVTVLTVLMSFCPSVFSSDMPLVLGQDLLSRSYPADAELFRAFLSFFFWLSRPVTWNFSTLLQPLSACLNWTITLSCRLRNNIFSALRCLFLMRLSGISLSKDMSCLCQHTFPIHSPNNSENRKAIK